MHEFNKACEGCKRYTLRAVATYEYGDISEYGHMQAVVTCKTTSKVVVKHHLFDYIFGKNMPKGAAICCKHLSQCEVHTFLGKWHTS